MTGVAKRFKSGYLRNVPILHILTSNKLVEQWNGFMKPLYTIERTLNLICIKWKSRIITWSLLLIESHKWENLYRTIFGAKCFNSQLTIFHFNESDFNVFFFSFFLFTGLYASTFHEIIAIFHSYFHQLHLVCIQFWLEYANADDDTMNWYHWNL